MNKKECIYSMTLFFYARYFRHAGNLCVNDVIHLQNYVTLPCVKGMTFAL